MGWVLGHRSSRYSWCALAIAPEVPKPTTGVQRAIIGGTVRPWQGQRLMELDWVGWG